MSEPKTIDFLKEPPIEGEAIEVSATEQEEPGTSLVVLDQVQANAVVLFSAQNGLDPIIEQIKKRVLSENLDISTPEGRLRIGSIARQIGSAKMRLKEMGVKVSEDAQKVVDSVRKERLRMETELDELRDQVRKPLDEWKESEEVRKAQHEADILAIETASTGSWADMTMEELKERRESLDRFKDKDWQEFVLRGEAALKTTLSILDDGIAKKEVWETEQAELAESRRKEQERKEAHQESIANIRALGTVNWPDETVIALENRLNDLPQYEKRNWEEFQNDATVSIVSARDSINAAIVSRKKWDDDQAELERRREEEIENKRIGAHKTKIAEVKALAAFVGEPLISEIEARKASLDNYRTADFQEFKDEADEAIAATAKSLDSAKAAEEEKIKKAKESVEEARKNALLAAITEIKAFPAFIETPTTQQIIARVSALEPYRKKDWQEFKSDADKAIADASKSLEASLEAAKERADQARRDADVEHKKKINNEAADAIVSSDRRVEGIAGVTLDQARKIITAIAKGEIPHVTIKY